MIVALEGTQIRNAACFHREISEKLNFGPYYGSNLSALLDALTSWVPGPVHLVWKDSAESQKNMGGDYECIVEVLRLAQAKDEALPVEQRFTFELR